MISLLIALTLLTAQPKDAERARTQSNRRTRSERKAEVPVPPPAPAASSAVQIPVTGSAVDPTGRKFTFSGIVTLTLEDPPPPLVPTISGIRIPGTTAFVTEAISGASLELVGAGLPATGLLRLTVGDKIATVRQWTPTLVQFTAPSVTTAFTGVTKIYAQINNNWTLVATGPSLTLRPGSVEVPALPRVDRFLALGGTAPDAFQIHQPVVLQGSGFGAQKGRVLVNWLEVPVAAWSETQIQATAGDGTDPDGTQWQILCPAGWLHVRGPSVTMP
jgi:hypothetical protein